MPWAGWGVQKRPPPIGWASHSPSSSTIKRIHPRGLGRSKSSPATMRPLLLLLMLCSRTAWAQESPAETECAGGPASWCRSLATAVRCGALRFCLRQGRGALGPGEDPCQDCQQVVTLLIRLAKESRFQKALRTYLEEKCEALPLQTLVPRCRALVDTYYDLFFTSLEEQVKPDLLCAKVGLCSSSGPLGPPDVSSPRGPELEQILWPQQGGQDPTLPNSPAQGGSPGEDLPIPLPMCWLCRNFVGRVESLIPKATIGQSMSQLCRLLPLSLTGMCECMVERYSVILVDMLVRKLGPDLICGLMRMCATDGNCGPEMPPGAPPGLVDRCRTCLGISHQVKAALKANSTREEVEVALILACAKTPFLDWQECGNFLRRHQTQLFRLLQKPWDAKTTCQELGDCTAQQEPPSATPFACAQGPAYWCSSLRTAEECKAIQHCQAHVWL